MRFHHSALFGLGAASALLIAGGTAYAANGAALLLGRSNAATATTALNNSRGTPLALSAPAGTPPLRVNTAAKVANLNADHLDGLDATAFASTGGRTGIVFGAADDRDGFVNTARCPSGTIATGGGGYATGTRDYLYYSGPDFGANGALIPNSWFAVANGETYAWVVCYNPRGPVKGAGTDVTDLPGHGTNAAASATDSKTMDPASAPEKQLP
jgi:hypothetical protein